MKQQWIIGACLAVGLLAAAAYAEDQAPPAAAPPPPTAQSGTKGSLVKIDGRLFVGAFDTGVNGAYPNRALDIPDAKLRFTFTPSKDITIVNRFSNNSATDKGFDYFYLDLNNWGGALKGHTLRLGKLKQDIGEETWTDNPVESILITNSAAHVSGYDGGINFRGPIPVGMPASYSLMLLNGTGSVGSATRGLATGAKVGVAPTKQLYLSASLFDSGDLVKTGGSVATPALAVASLGAPTGITLTGWKRTLWELDARWNYGKTGIKSEIPSGADTSRYQIAAAYGRFKDDFSGVGSVDRKGNYWFAEGQYNATDKLYFATRYSQVKLNSGITAVMVDSPVAVNKYTRLSLGAGYHLTPLIDLKAEVTQNTTSGGASKPKLNQVAVGIATKF